MAASPRLIMIRLTMTGVAVAALGLFGAQTFPAHASEPGPFKIPDAQYEPVTWSDIARWADDDHAAAFGAFLISCRAVSRRKPVSNPDTVLYNALIEVCRQAVKVGPLKNPRARAFFEKHFRPVRIKKIGDEAGFLTGYYEPIVDGSRFPSPEFHAPLYRRPPDLAVAGRKPGGSIPNKAKIVRVVEKNDKKKQVEYYDRGAIEDGALDGKHLEITWLRDHITTFVIQIQGSARVRLEDGTMLRVNYDAHNGHPYTAVGRILMERGYIARHEMSMARIRNWMKYHPDEGREVRHKNRSFVFFRITGLGNDDEPSGAQGVPLTPGRSIAVDRQLHSYGTPFFIEADLPLDDERGNDKFNRLTIAQDTGSAIVGPARADIYFGSGDGPGAVAGRIRNKGQFVMLVPNEIDPVAAGRLMPLPLAKPKPPKAEKSKGKGKLKKKNKTRPEAKGEEEPEANSTASAAEAGKPDIKQPDVKSADTRPSDANPDAGTSQTAKSDSKVVAAPQSVEVKSLPTNPGPLTSIALVDPKAAAAKKSAAGSKKSAAAANKPAADAAEATDTPETTASIGGETTAETVLPLPRPRPAVEQKRGRRSKARSKRSRASRESRRRRAAPWWQRPPAAIGRQ